MVFHVAKYPYTYNRQPWMVRDWCLGAILVVKFIVPPDTQQLPVLQAVQAVPVQPVPVQPMLPGLKSRDLARESV